MAEKTKEKVAKPDFKVRLSEKYAIDTDKLNIILLERYETRLGKGKDAPMSGLYSWRQVGFFQNLNFFAEWLVKHELFTAEGVTELKHYADVIEKLKDEIADVLVDKIEVKLD